MIKNSWMFYFNNRVARAFGAPTSLPHLVVDHLRQAPHYSGPALPMREEIPVFGVIMFRNFCHNFLLTRICNGRGLYAFQPSTGHFKHTHTLYPFLQVHTLHLTVPITSDLNYHYFQYINFILVIFFSFKMQTKQR